MPLPSGWVTEPSEPREFRYADLIGRWRLRLTPAFRDFVIGSLAHDAPPHLAGTTPETALHEAAGAELEFLADGCFISRSHGIELLRAQIPTTDASLRELIFEKAPGQQVQVRFVSAGELAVQQPNKPTMQFERVLSER